MVTDTIILILITAIVLVVGLILWRAAEPKTYDPNAVDHSANFDPKHDHFSKDHAKKFQQLASQPRKDLGAAAVASRSESESIQSAEPAWDEHLISPEVVSAKARESAEEKERRAESDRRKDQDRRNQDRRTLENRRTVSSES